MKFELEQTFAVIAALLVLFSAMIDAGASLALAVVLFAGYIALRAARLRKEQA